MKRQQLATEHSGAVCCADCVWRCVCLQGRIVSQFSPANKCSVAPQEHVHEYTPDVSKNAQSSTAVPVCGSLSVQPGDCIVVMQVGTVGVVQNSGKDKQGTHSRRLVQHAVLVLLTPGDGGPQRSEVLTGKQVQEKEHMVAWLHSGCPTMDPRKVLCCLCRYHCCVQSLSVFLCS